MIDYDSVVPGLSKPVRFWVLIDALDAPAICWLRRAQLTRRPPSVVLQEWGDVRGTSHLDLEMTIWTRCVGLSLGRGPGMAACAPLGCGFQSVHEVSSMNLVLVTRYSTIPYAIAYIFLHFRARLEQSQCCEDISDRNEL